MSYYKNITTAIIFFIIIWAIVNSIILIAANQPIQRYTRIVSLSPSITAMIQDLACEHLLVGVTQFHPPLSRKIPVVGTITNPNSEVILGLEPDIILYSKEDSATQKIEMLQHTGCTLYGLPAADSFDAICSNYLTIAEILNKKDYAMYKLSHYKKKRDKLLHTKTGNAIILLSGSPLIAVSRRSYISNIFADAGIANTLDYNKTRYPIVQQEYLIASDVDMIVVLCNDTVPDAVVQAKKIIRIPYDGLYLYTPFHYCNSLHHVVGVLYSQ